MSEMTAQHDQAAPWQLRDAGPADGRAVDRVNVGAVDRMDAHPAADLFPLMDDAALAELAEDIKARGLIDPIVRHEGLILDGRNRDRACDLAEVEPRYVDWDGSGGSPVLFVLSVNLKRRHLNESQRAMVGAKSLPMLEAEARERTAEAARQMQAARRAAPSEQEEMWADRPTSLPSNGSESRGSERGPDRSRDRAAKAVGSSGRMVARAKRVREADPDLARSVEQGARTLDSAEHEIRERQKQAKAERQIAMTPTVDVTLFEADATDLKERVPDASVDVILTSPPYGLEKPYHGYADLAEGWEAFMREWLREAFRVARSPGRLILNVPLDTAKGYRPTWPQACRAAIDAGWTYRGCILWDKFNSTKGNRGLGSENSADAPYPVPEAEVIGLFYKGAWKLGDGRISDIRPEDWQAWGGGVWRVRPEIRPWEGHPAPFPEELVRRLLLYLTRVGDTVLDPFCGSGTTPLVARRLKRVPIGVDRSAAYIASAARRIAAWDGESAP